MAGEFARAVGAKHLVLTHFGRSVAGDSTLHAQAVLKQVVRLARERYSGHVLPAEELMQLTLGVQARPRFEAAPRPNAAREPSLMARSSSCLAAGAARRGVGV